MLPSLFNNSILYNKTDLDEQMPVKFILTEKEKFDDDMAAVKRIFRYYESIGHVQVKMKDREVRKLYNLAYGQLNMEDYVEVDSEYAAATGAPDAKLEDLKIDFYPIIPTFVRGVLGSFDKMYSEYTAQAVNPEATNDILAKLDADLRSSLLQNVEAVFQLSAQGQPVDVVEQKHKLLMESQEVQKFYKTKFRTTVEEWAMHTMFRENAQFQTDMKERRLLEQEVVTGDPTIHIDYSRDRYKPDILNERDTFYMKSPTSRDYSESQMFGWFDLCTFQDILNEYGSELSTKQVEQISSWSQTWAGETFTVNGLQQPFNKSQGLQDSKHNLRTLEATLRFHRNRSMVSEMGMSGDLVKLTTVYFYVPRKYGMLTFKSGSNVITETVDETFKVTIKPIYEPDKEKDEDSLISGEHVEWYYKPELWRGKKVAAWGFQPNGSVDFKDSEVWIELGRCEIQYSDPHTDNLYIPVHGGSVTNQYNDSTSPVKAAAPWQIMYNWVWNRNKQLLSTEIGKFYAMPESSIPNEDLDGAWGTYGLEKFVTMARDTQIASLNNPLAQNGSPSLGQQGGFGSTVDMTNTQDILHKATLAQALEAACYRSVGLTPEFLLGDISSEQSAKSVAMGQQRTATQLQNLFTRVSEIMVKARTTMLATAQHIAAKHPTTEMAYTTPQAERILFRSSTMEFPLHKMGVYVKSNGSDLAVIEAIKNYVASNNTMGADSYEMATLLAFKSLPQLFNELKDIQDKKEAQKQQEFQQQQALQQQQIQATQQQLEKEMQQKAYENSLDRDRDIMVAQIKTLGYADGTAEEVQKAVLDLRTANAQQKELYARAETQTRIQAAKERTADQTFAHKQQDLALKQRVELEKLAQTNRELDLREMDIKARNKRTQVMD
jgi:hypothetical protein